MQPTKFKLERIDFSTVTTPPSGTVVIGFDIADDILKYKDSNGVLHELGGIPSGTAIGNTLYWDGVEWKIDSSNIFNNNGNVGIGQFSQSLGYVPGEKVEIHGNILSKGFVWTVRDATENKDWRSVTYGNGVFVAVAASLAPAPVPPEHSNIMTSSDGINWVKRYDTNNNTLLSVAYGNGRFVAVGSAATIYSTDGGQTWSAGAASGGNGITYGNGVFVVVATNYVATSVDGLVWTPRVSPAANDWTNVTYGNGTFVAVAYDGPSNHGMYSTDGITWVLTNLPSGATYAFVGVTYGNGLFVAVSLLGHIYTSPNGIIWTPRTNPLGMTPLMTVVYGASLFVALAQSGVGQVLTSPDGITWLARAAAENNGWTSVCYGNGVFVAVTLAGVHRVMTSGKTEQNLIP